MPSVEVLSITLPSPLLQEAQQIARTENRSVDELVLEALQRYREDKQFEASLEHGRATAAAVGARDEQDVIRIVHEFRRENRDRSSGPLK